MTSVTIDRTDGLNSAAAIKGPCRAATTANIALTGLQTIDGVVLAAGDRVLVKNQTSGSENGIWIADTGPWRRSKDFNKTKDVVTGTFVLVTDGTANADRSFMVDTANPVSVGTTSISFVRGFATPAEGDLASTAIQPADAGRLLFSHSNTYLAGSVGSVLKRFVRVTDAPFNAVMNGTTDDAAALQAAIDYVFSLGGGCVLIPPGVMASSGVTLKASVDIWGAGKNASQIRPTANSVTLFSSINVAATGVFSAIGNFSINCGVGTAKTGVTGFKLTFCNEVTLRDIIFFGCLRNFDIDRGGLHHIISCVSSGVSTLKAGSFFLGSTDDSLWGGVFTTIESYRIENTGTGVQSPACYFRRAIGIHMTDFISNDSDYTGTCIVVENDCQGIYIDGLVPAYNIGLFLTKGAGIDKSPIQNSFVGLDFDQNATSAIYVEAGENNSFGSSKITSSNIGTTTKAVVFTGAAVRYNSVHDMKISGFYGTGGSAILLNNVNGMQIRDVDVDGCYNGIEFSGTNTNILIADCDLAGGIGGITNPILGTVTGAGNRIINCRGYAPVVTSPAVPATNVDYTNNFGFPCRVFVIGGTVTGVYINGILCGFTNTPYILYPGERIKWQGTVAPTWNWAGI